MKKTVLVVDDAPLILIVIKKMLSALGCRLLLASSGEQALEMTTKHDEKIDLLLTDVMMPGMNGLELAYILKNKLPKIKVVFMSGFKNDVIAHYDGLIEPEENFIQKPLIPTKLIDKLRAMLDEK